MRRKAGQGQLQPALRVLLTVSIAILATIAAAAEQPAEPRAHVGSTRENAAAPEPAGIGSVRPEVQRLEKLLFWVTGFLAAVLVGGLVWLAVWSRRLKEEWRRFMTRYDAFLEDQARSLERVSTHLGLDHPPRKAPKESSEIVAARVREDRS